MRTRRPSISAITTFLFFIATIATCAMTVGEAKLLADGTPVIIDSAIVTAAFADERCIYVQDVDRTAGIRIESVDTGFDAGDMINVQGVVGTYKPDGLVSGERRISNAIITRLSTGETPKPLGMNGRAIGGGPLGSYVPGVADGVGLNNMGLLVRTAGQVTSTSGYYFHLDDGSNVADIQDKTGVLVLCSSNTPSVQVGDGVLVTGVVKSSVPIGWTQSRRFLRMRDKSDIRFELGDGTGTISGVITDTSGAPISGANVSTTSDNYTATTSSDGSFSITNVAAGAYDVEVSKFGYLTRTISYQVVRADQTLTVNTQLVTDDFSPFVDNGDFEAYSEDGVADGWIPWREGTSRTIDYAIDTVDHLAGRQCQRWGRADGRAFTGGLVSCFETVPGIKYEVIAWVRMNAADSNCNLALGTDLTGQVNDGTAATVNYEQFDDEGNRRWVRFRRIIEATGSSISIFAKLSRTNDTANANWAYLDNVSVQPRMELEPEDYDTAYDTTSGNFGNVYRTGDVDIASAPTGGYTVGWTDAGEWVEWNDVGFIGGDCVAVIDYSGWSDAAVSLSIDGSSVASNAVLPKSGWWDAYRRVIIPGVISTNSGAHDVRLTINTAGCNIDRITLVPVSKDVRPYIEAEDYFTYFDNTSGNSGGQYRTDSVDIYSGGTNYYVGATSTGEWLEYPISGDARAYVAVIRYATSNYSSKCRLEINDNSITGSISLPRTGSGTTWKSLVTPQITLPTGENTMRLYVEYGGFNIDYIALIPLGDGESGSNLLTGVHFASNPSNGLNDMVSQRGNGNWIYTTEAFSGNGGDPADPGFVSNMANYINGLLKPLYQNRVRVIQRLDWKWGETIPRLLPDGSIDTVAVNKYAVTFKKFAEIAEANGVPIRHFIVGNEMNLKGEATGFENGYIPEWYYAYVYDIVRAEMNDLGPGYEVLVGAVSPAMEDGDPIATPGTLDPNIYSTDGYVYMDNVVKELKKKGTQDVAFALHAYADFDANRNYTTNFYWVIRKQLEIIEKSHDVVPEGQTQTVTISGYPNAPVYVTEWNRHTPQEPIDNRVIQETATSNFIKTAIERIRRFNLNREVYDNISGVYRTYDHRDVRHNFHPIKALCYFVFSPEGVWGDYSLKHWHTLEQSATGADDMYNVYQTETGKRDPGGR